MLTTADSWKAEGSLNGLCSGLVEALQRATQFVKSAVIGGHGEPAPAQEPTIEFLETEQGYLVRAMMAGLPKRAIRVSWHRDVLTISGSWKKPDRASRRTSSHSYGASFALPGNAKRSQAVARYEGQGLSIHIPKG